jgi:hypothetical protein
MQPKSKKEKLSLLSAYRGSKDFCVAYFPNGSPFYGRIVHESSKSYRVVGSKSGRLKVYTFPKDFVETVMHPSQQVLSELHIPFLK